MSRVLMLLVALLGTAPVGGEEPTRRVDLTQAKALTLKICDRWVAYRVGQDLLVLCPGMKPPPNAIVLREYYEKTKK